MNRVAFSSDNLHEIRAFLLPTVWDASTVIVLAGEQHIEQATMTTITESAKHGFQRWWHAPVSRKDRLLGVTVGAIGCFWIACFGRGLLGPLPIDLGALAVWSICGAVAGVLLGTLFPKAVMCACLPFATFGGGS
ncbi:hypothetical protein [Rhizobacter sp. P5_C2]